MMQPEQKLKTYVAPLLKARQAEPSATKQDEQENKTSEYLLNNSNEPIHWLDELLNGGFLVFKDTTMAILFSGLPGTGKSLLAQQICYSRHINTTNTPEIRKRCLYISFETTKDNLLLHQKSLGWWSSTKSGPATATIEHAKQTQLDNGEHTSDSSFIIADTSGFEVLKHAQNEKNKDINLLDARGSLFTENVSFLWRCGPPAAESIIVFDGISCLSQPTQSIVGKWLINLAGSLVPKPAISIIIVDEDSSSIESTAALLSHQADGVFRFKHELLGGSATRTLEIEKLRFQNHVRGKHFLKTYNWMDDFGGRNVDSAGSRPVLDFGGVYIFPSIDFLVSKQRIDGGRPFLQLPTKEPPSGIREPDREIAQGTESQDSGFNSEINWFLPDLKKLVGCGMPRGRCTAIVGERGSGKMTLAYRFLLDAILNNENSMIISHQENSQAVRQGLLNVWTRKDTKTVKACIQNGSGSQSSRQFEPYTFLGEQINPVFNYSVINGNLKSGQSDSVSEYTVGKFGTLRVVYQAPGIVSPDEFLHRLLFWIGQDCVKRAVLGPVDQWPSLFPQLASSPRILPSIIYTLDMHDVTSMVIGVPDGRTGTVQDGLLSSAEFILSLKREPIFWPPEKAGKKSKGLHSDGFLRGAKLSCQPTADAVEKLLTVVRAERITRRGVFNGEAVLLQGRENEISLKPLSQGYRKARPSGN